MPVLRSGALIAVLGLALLAPLAAGTARADGHTFGGAGLILLANIATENDGLVYYIDGVSLPGDGEAYEGWLVNSATGERRSTGVMAVGADASIAHVYWTPGGESILELGYDTVEITLEPAPDTDAGPGRTVYAYTQPEALWIEVQHLISHGLPPERAGERGPGDPDLPGDLQALLAALEESIGLAEAAMRAETPDGFRESVRRLLALEEQLLLEEAAIHTELAAGAHGPGIDMMIALVDYYAANAEARTLRVRDRAQAALAADSLEAGKAALLGAADGLRSARGAVFQSYRWAQQMAAFPVPELPLSGYGGAPPALLAVVDPPALLAAADRDPFGGFGQIALIDEQNELVGSGGVAYDVDGAALPGEGEAYEGWLVNSATGERISTGVMEVSPLGDIDHIYLTPGGENILELGYDTVEITLEPAPGRGRRAGPAGLRLHPAPAALDPRPAPDHARHPAGARPRAGPRRPRQPRQHPDPGGRSGNGGRSRGSGHAGRDPRRLPGVRPAAARPGGAAPAGGGRDLHRTDRRRRRRRPHRRPLGQDGGRPRRRRRGRTLRVRARAQAALAADSLEAGKAALGGAAGELTAARGAIVHAREWALRIVTFPAPSIPFAAAGGQAPALSPVLSNDGNAGLAAAGGGTAAWGWVALFAAIGALAGAAAHTRRGPVRRGAA